jgi:predicted ribosome quality control (RQC) complex YloA/Tae2 family protein
MISLAPVKTIEQDAIAKKIKELLNQLPLKDRLEVEGEVSRSISEELAAKKEACGKNRQKWRECLNELGFVPQDAEKRIKLTKIPSWAWGIGTLMVCQIATPTYSDMLDDLLKQDSITQELTKARMDEVKEARKLERIEKKAREQAEAESKFLEWTRNIHGIRTLLATIHEAAGNKLEYFFSTFRKASDGEVEFNLFVNELLQVYESSDHWLEIEAIADYNEQTNITPENISLAQVGPGMRVKIVNQNSPRFGQQARITSFNNGSGWTGVFDDEQLQTEFIGTTEVVVVAI